MFFLTSYSRSSLYLFTSTTSPNQQETEDGGGPVAFTTINAFSGIGGPLTDIPLALSVVDVGTEIYFLQEYPTRIRE